MDWIKFGNGLDSYSDVEMNNYKKCIQYLLEHSFLVKNVSGSNELYSFASNNKNFENIRACFSLMDVDVKCDRVANVIYTSDVPSSLKQKPKKLDTAIKLILKKFYLENINPNYKSIYPTMQVSDLNKELMTINTFANIENQQNDVLRALNNCKKNNLIVLTKPKGKPFSDWYFSITPAILEYAQMHDLVKINEYLLNYSESTSEEEIGNETSD